ncbi:TetR/AcrR family transcriptional regulator [Paenibacillus pinisoli]|uniref:TetR/AcrR family transcriptional regulator n=1 Tax=Paenibacillus pinisoli TaxID=1276110 RepID=A0A3A6PLF6_9BACL|nr:TetR/AcrR family transcriptional regulator [Paenibacillus pinisoli]RJX37221.1 TetR/AcrR family transcriptional regulator [Paenibacillus pinisoli]
MEPKTRYKQELSELKQHREQVILETAERVFSDNGIEKTTMHHIAKEASIGIATLFRYFPKKEKLIVAVATNMIEEVFLEFQKISQTDSTCLEKMELLFDFFIAPLPNHYDRNIKFLEDFENYAAHSDEPLEDMDEFNRLYRRVSLMFSRIIQDGQEDGSLRSDISVRETLTTVINAFAIFSRKLSLQRNILRLELDLEPEKQLTVLKHILLDYLKA